MPIQSTGLIVILLAAGASAAFLQDELPLQVVATTPVELLAPNTDIINVSGKQTITVRVMRARSAWSLRDLLNSLFEQLPPHASPGPPALRAPQCPCNPLHLHTPTPPHPTGAPRCSMSPASTL